MAIKLDVKDKKILSILDMDARLPLSKIAKKVGLSREVVHYRIKQLEKKKVILGYYTVLDVSKLGLMYCRTFFKYRNLSHEKEKEIIAFCKKNKYITWVILGEGKFDLSIMIVCESLDIIEKVYDEIHAKFGSHFQKPYISLAFRIYHYKHNYLFNQSDERELILGSKKKVSVDNLDTSLLDILSNNARLSLVDLAQKLSSSPKVINYRIKKLIQEQVILSFRAKINSRLLGYDYYKIFLSLQQFDEQNMKKMVSNKEIISI